LSKFIQDDCDGRLYSLEQKEVHTKMKGGSMNNQIMIITLLLLLSLFAGCVYVNPLVQAGEQKETLDQTTAIQVCQISCENHIKYFPLGCICPETPTPVPRNITPTLTEK
jgi:hypothetical protein